MTAIDAPHSRVLYLDGEGITLDDMNNGEARMLARLTDLFTPGFFYNSAYPERKWATPASTMCLSPRSAAGYPYWAGSGLIVGSSEGWLCQRNGGGPSSPDGDDAVLLSAFMPDNSSLFTLSAASGSNPRIDLIQVRLTEIDDDAVDRDFEGAVTRAKSTFAVNTSKRVQIDIEVKEGTPAANPVTPTPDSGYAEWARIRVPTSATALTADDIFDMRVPMHVEAQRIHPYMLGRPLANWTIATGNQIGIVTSGSGPYPCYAFPHTGVNAGRIIGCYVDGIFVESGGQAVDLVRYDENGASAPNVVVMADLYSPLGGTFAAWRNTNFLLGAAATNDHDQRPVWTNYYGPHKTVNDAHGNFFKVGLRINGNVATTIYEAGFIIATDI